VSRSSRPSRALRVCEPRAAASRPARARVLALAALLAGFLGVGLVGAAPALAHAELASTDPADGSRLDAAPSQVRLTFTESVSLDVGYVRVVDGRGQRVDTGPVTHPDGTGSAAAVALRTGLGSGGYVVSYRVVSADSHPISGAFAFTVGDGPLVSASGAVAEGSGTDGVVNALFAGVRWISFVGLVLLGGLIFVAVCWSEGRTDQRARRIIWTGWVLGVGASVGAVLLQGPYASGEPVTSVFSPDLLSATLGTTYGRMQSVRLIALGALAVLLVRLLRELPAAEAEQARARDEDLAAVLGLVVLATYGASGHAVAGIQPTVAVLSDTVHLAAVASWVGGLVLLTTCLLPGRRVDELAAVLPRFSRLAFGAVIVLVVTGTYQAWREVGTPPALLSTDYGRLLSLKIAGFVLLVSLGNLGRIAVRRRYGGLPVAYALAHLAEPDPAPRSDARVLSRLRRSVALEVGIAGALLALTAVLVSQAPARASYGTAYDTTLRLASGGTTQLTVTPARQGVNTVHLYVFDSAGKLTEPAGVGLEITLPAEQIGPLPVTLVKAGPGYWQSTTVSFPKAGSWQLVVRVRASEFESSVASAQVSIR